MSMKLPRAQSVPLLTIAHRCLCLLIVAFVLIAGSLRAAGQGPQDCHHVPVAMDLPDPQGFIAAASPATCTDGTGNSVSNVDLPSGVYLKAGIPIRIDTEAHTTGTCFQYAFDWWNYVCYYSGIAEMQPLWKDDVFTTPPSPPGSTNTFYAPYPSRSLDTRNGQGLQTGFTAIGEYVFGFQSGAYPTVCTDVMYSLLVPKTAVIVACAPQWRPNDAGSLLRFPTDGQEIAVVYSTENSNALDAAVRPAIQSWNDVLGRAGLTSPHFTPTPGGSCALNDPHCIVVDVQTSPSEPTACGWRYSPNSQTGVYTQRSMIHLRPGYNGWPPAAQNWTVAHELGHLLDLNEQGFLGTNALCADSGSVMHAPATCGDVGSATGPTDSDALAVAKTPYGSGPRISCS